MAPKSRKAVEEDAETIEMVRTALQSYLNDLYITFSTATEEHEEVPDLRSRIVFLLMNDLVPFMKLTKEGRVYITPGILDELGLEYFESLKPLADLLGWKYVIKKTKRRLTPPLIEITIDELVDFLSLRWLEEE